MGLKVIITGASGLLGRRIFEECQKRNFEVIGLAFSRPGKNFVKCDLTHPGEVDELVLKLKPDFLVHAAAERYPDKVEQDYENARILNIETSRRLSQLAKKVGSRLLYISTDYVFDGTSPPHKVGDPPNPLNKYGLTKYEGEKAVLAESEDACILRIPVLYGIVEKLEDSAVTSLLLILLSREHKSVNHYERRYPSNTTDIARIICDLIVKVHEDPTLNGIFQWSGRERLTKYEMCQVIGKVFSLPEDHINADTKPTSGAGRPYDSQMDNSRLEKLGIAHHTPFAEGIRESLSPWVEAYGTSKKVAE